MEIWQHGDAARWHAVRVDSSTVSGVPFFKSPACDSCRVSVPRTSVDSIRVGDTDGAFWRTLTLVLGLSVMAFYIKSAIAS